MNTIPTIKTFEQLKQILHSGPGYDGLGTMLKSIEFADEELEKFCKWDDDNYQKIVIESVGNTELVLMCWEPGQASPIHDHAGRQSWILVLEGELTEFYYYPPDSRKFLDLRSSEVIGKGKLAYINDHLGVHKIVSHPEQRTISLHLYAGEKEQRQEFEQKNGESIEENE